MKRSVTGWRGCVLLMWLAGCSYDPIAPHHADAGDAGDAGDAQASDDASFEASTDADFDADHAMTDGGDAGDAQASDDAGDAQASNDAGDAQASNDAGDGSVDGSDGSMDGPPHVEPLFDNAPYWTDWVVDDDPHDHIMGENLERHADPCTNDTAIDTIESCVHGGRMRKLVVHELSDCLNVSATDAEGWFEWTCEEENDHVLFKGVPRSSFTLADYVNPSGAGYRDDNGLAQIDRFGNQVTVRRGATLIVQSIADQDFWPDAVAVIGADATASGVLNFGHTIYVLARDDFASPVVINADHIAILAVDPTPEVVLPGALPEVRFRVDAPLDGAVITGDANFLWLEGFTLETDAQRIGIDLTTTFSVLRDLRLVRTTERDSGDHAELRADARASVFEGITVENARLTGIDLAGDYNILRNSNVFAPIGVGVKLATNRSLISNVFVDNARSHGMHITGVATQVEHVRVESSSAHGLLLEDSTECVLRQIATASNLQHGVVISPSAGHPTNSHNNTISEVTSTNNRGAGVLVRGRNQRLSHITTASNGRGIDVGGTRHVVQHVTSVFNTAAGIAITTGENPLTLINALAVHNGIGFNVTAQAEGARVHDLAAAHNTTDILIDGDGNRFSGTLWLTDGTCEINPSLDAPGLDNSGGTCVNAPPSTVSITSPSPSQLATPFVGRVAVGDSANTQTSHLDGDGALPDDWVNDWTTFSVPARSWVRYQSGSLPNVAFHGPCGTSVDDRCTTWDWRISGMSPARNVFAYPLAIEVRNAPAHQVTHRWDANNNPSCTDIPGGTWDGSICTTRLLAYGFEPSRELADGGKGNGNALCEDDETCALQRHRGAYPGEGSLEASDTVEVIGFGAIHLTAHLSGAPLL